MFRDGEAADKASLMAVVWFPVRGLCHAWSFLDLRGVEVDPSYFGVSEISESRDGDFGAGSSASDSTGVLVRVVKLESSEYSMCCWRAFLTTVAF